MRFLLYILLLLSPLALHAQIEMGKASFYGDEFEGRTTANGEIYKHNALTAAHKTLPFNTLVQVTNLANNKTVTVRINDRGPFPRVGLSIYLNQPLRPLIWLQQAW